MKTFTDMIVSYLNNEATEEELKQIQEVIKTKLEYRELKIDLNTTKNYIVDKCKEIYKESDNKLLVVKTFKQMTGMSLIDAKNYCEQVIF